MDNNIIWYINKKEQFSSTELLLLLGLCHLYEIQYTHQYISASNKELCSLLHISEPTLLQARFKLKEKGIINYISGKSRNHRSCYDLINVYKQSGEKIQELNLDQLFLKLKSDNKWHDGIINRCKKYNNINLCISELMDYFDEFYSKLLSEGVNKKDLNDAKKHFSSWLNLQIQKKQINKRNKKSNKTKKINGSVGNFKQGVGWNEVLSDIIDKI